MKQGFFQFKRYRWLILILACSLAARIALVFSGGQLFWYDEHRYQRSINLLHALAAGHWRTAATWACEIPHPAFALVAAPAALMQTFLERALHCEPMSLVIVPSLYLSLFSLATIFLIYQLARRSGASHRQANLAAFFAAGSSSLLLYSRHLLPYDAALAFALGALVLGYESTDRKRLVGSGVLCGLAVTTYYGYATVSAVVLALLLLQDRRPSRLLSKTLCLGAGLIAPLLFFFGLSLLTTEGTVWSRVGGFAMSVNQGEPRENWSLPAAYYWATDPLLLVISISAVGELTLYRRRLIRRSLPWLGIAAVIYILLVIPACWGMVTYGRLARQMTPFLCLGCAFGMERLLEKRLLRRSSIVLVFIALLAEALLRFFQPFSMRFPRDIQARVRREFSHVAQDTTVTGPYGRPEPIGPETRYVLLNTKPLFPIRGIKPPPQGKVLFQSMHPLQFLPFQYEGYGPKERTILREGDISIRLIELATQQSSRTSDKSRL